MAHGRFITFEGGEGTGKSTQAGLLAERLRRAGHGVLETREPGGTPEAERIRALLVTGEAGRWSPRAEALLNYAARDHHLEAQIRPAVAQGTWVVCDRYMDSTRAYQGITGGVSRSLIEVLEREIIGDTVPDLTFVLDLEPETGLARAASRGGMADNCEDRFEGKGLAFHRTLRQAFLDIADADRARCQVVDATQTEDRVAQIIWDTVATRLAP